jgi:hypothetical protein
MSEAVFMKLDMYIMTPDTSYFIKPISLCVYMCIPLYLLGNGLVKNFTAATNTHATIEELLDASYQRKVGLFFPELVRL